MFLLITEFNSNILDCQNTVLSILGFVGNKLEQTTDSLILSFLYNQVVFPLFEETKLFLHKKKGQIY